MAFAVAGADPIPHLFSWLSNLATASVLVQRRRIARSTKVEGDVSAHRDCGH
jgi:hypothetical protein